jgi:hypothetical protein
MRDHGLAVVLVGTATGFSGGSLVPDARFGECARDWFLHELIQHSSGANSNDDGHETRYQEAAHNLSPHS